MNKQKEHLPSWEVLIYKSRTDANFRKSLIDNPDKVLRDQGLLKADEIIVLHEWKPNVRFLILPPLLTQSSNQVMEAEHHLAPNLNVNPSSAKRAPSSKNKPSKPLAGPSICRLNNSTTSLT